MAAGSSFLLLKGYFKHSFPSLNAGSRELAADGLLLHGESRNHHQEIPSSLPRLPAHLLWTIVLPFPSVSVNAAPLVQFQADSAAGRKFMLL